MNPRKKLIEVALPLEAINTACQKEKYNPFLKDHPRVLHHWWARRPLAACRAVLFASLVDDPGSRPGLFPTEVEQRQERERLFRLIEELVKWENTDNEHVLEAARAEIRRSTDGHPPPVLDPFCGGGSIPLEAQRLGLEAYASDLNPVAVLITKALIEIPPHFTGRAPVNPEQRRDTLGGGRKSQSAAWKGVAGLAADVRYYGAWMRDQAQQRIGHLYPTVSLPSPRGRGQGEGAQATVIAWLWARTVRCPNPACGAQMPLVRSFWLSTRKGREAWVEPMVDRAAKVVRFEVRTGRGAPPEGTVNRRGARCIVCDQAVPFAHVRAEGKAGRMSAQLMAVVAEGAKGRAYLPPSGEQEGVVAQAKPAWAPETRLPERALGFRVQAYGMTMHRDLFSPRQLVALTTLSDLVGEARGHVCRDAVAAGLPDDGVPLDQGGRSATAYADTVATYLACAVSRSAAFHNNLTSWNAGSENFRQIFVRQTIAMIWDYAEAAPLAGVVGFGTFVDYAAHALGSLPAHGSASVEQLDASSATMPTSSPLVSTDPPYYDNIGYADLADFFYVWLRRTLSGVYPQLFSTVLTPKAEELVATPYRFDNGMEEARSHFVTGLQRAFYIMRQEAHSEFPLTVFYAFKQAEEDGEQGSSAQASTGWETMLEGLVAAGLRIVGTWPMRTERPTGVKVRTNALASSIVLVCRPRADDAPLATRREFQQALHAELPAALRRLQQGYIAPVDFAQAAIGPGMAVYSRYGKVLQADGSPMPVRTALQLINAELDEYLTALEGEVDADTRFCIAWFETHGMDEAPFGEADVLARAKNTSVQGLAQDGTLRAQAGKVRLLRRDEYPDDWDPARDRRLTVWECTQYLIRALERDGEEGAARLAVRLGGGRSEEARALAYRLYAICERKGWTQEALAYNLLAAAWGEVQSKAAALPGQYQQAQLPGGQ